MSGPPSPIITEGTGSGNLSTTVGASSLVSGPNATANGNEADGGLLTATLNSPRFKSGDDIDPLREERSGTIREVGSQAIWSLSSCKPGYGVDQLRDSSLENYWQSDGQLPHLVNIQFRRRTTIRDICIYTDFKLDESYTPSKISIRSGTHFNDLQEVEVVEFTEPSGWVQIFLKDIRDRPISTFMLQLAVLSNHQNGRDTHLRQIRIHTPVHNYPVGVFPGVFTTKMVHSIHVSLWLHQAVKGYRDKDGNPVPNAHLLGLFHRICKLLNFGVRPVFVFDGGVPALKKQTIAIRKQKKLDSEDKSETARVKLLSNYLRQKLQKSTGEVVPRLPGSPNKSPSKSPTKKPFTNNEFDEDLAQYVENLRKLQNSDGNKAKISRISSSSSEDDDDYFASSRNYADDFGTITSPHFDTLPLETQHEVLFQMQDSKKTNSWNKMHEMPRELKSFSTFQMDRLLKRSYLQKKIQSVQKEMGQRHIHVQSLDELAAFEAEFGQDSNVPQTQIIGSKDKGALLIKSSNNGSQSYSTPTPSTSAPVSSRSSQKFKPNQITIEDYVEEWSSESDSDVPEIQISSKSKKEKINELTEEEELELAISLSLQASAEMQAKTTNKPVIVKAVSRNSSPVKIRSITSSPTKSYQNIEKPTDFVQAEDMTNPCYKFLGWVGFADRVIPTNDAFNRSNSSSQSSASPVTKIEPEAEKQDKVTETISSESEFEEVEDKAESEIEILGLLKPKEDLENKWIKVSVDKFDPEEDLFADVFGGVEVKKARYPPYNENDSENVKIDSSEDSESLDVEIESQPEEKIAWKSNGDLAQSPKFLEVQSISQASATTTSLQHITATDSSKDFVELVEKEDQQEPLRERKESHNTIPMESISKNQTIQRTLGVLPTKNPAPSKPRIITGSYLMEQQKLVNQEEKLRLLKGQHERVATSITDQMYIEAQELLDLFGIPFIVSPMEAEAQCAFLDTACLTEGTITDDSDIWLFGGRRVYKNFFSAGDREVEFYQYSNILTRLSLDREKFIIIAMLCGSDYTTGIEGVGPVTALEILTEFSGKAEEETGISPLVKFHEWWTLWQGKSEFFEAENRTRQKLRKLKIKPGFPNSNIYNAYMNPTIDTSMEPLKWGTPKHDPLQLYLRNKFGWDNGKSETILAPIMRNFEARIKESTSKQLTLDNFVTRNPFGSPVKRGIKSKRLAKAMNKLKQIPETSAELNLSSESSDDDEVGTSIKRKPKPKGRKRQLPPTNVESAPQAKRRNKKPNSSNEEPAGPKPKVRIPKTQLPIPQKIRTEEEMNLRKEKAAKLLKK